MSSTAGLQATTKHSGFPVRMENAVPIVPQAPAAQPLQIQSGVLTQVKKDKITTRIPELTVFPISVQENLTYLLVLGVNAGRFSEHSERFKCRSPLRQCFLVLFFWNI